jgi:hypothetical protein
MNDVTKARYFLKANGSKLQTLETFALMLATAEARYKDLQMKIRTRAMPIQTRLPMSLDVAEVDAALEYAVLRYLKRHNQLPKNASKAFGNGVTLEEKRALAEEWIIA